MKKKKELKKGKNWDKFQRIIMIINLIFILFFTGSFISHDDNLRIKINPNEKINDSNIQNCSKYSELSNYTYCINDYFKTFFKYKVRLNKVRTLEDIKENGGSCYDATYLWKRVLENEGFSTKIVILDPFDSEHTGHVKLLAWSYKDKKLNEYCDIDITEVHCYTFK